MSCCERASLRGNSFPMCAHSRQGRRVSYLGVA